MASYLETFVRNVSGVIMLLASFLTIWTTGYASHHPPGFISIDCGSVAASTDPRTNLSWVQDGDYMLTGKNGAVRDPDLVNSSLDNYHALRTFRYFPEAKLRNKYCYELPLTTSNVSFVLRAMFLHGDAPELSLPVEFDVYVNATPWMNVNYTLSDDLYEPRVRESIFYVPLDGNITNVCLVPVQGVPFISSLELRQLDDEGLMYSHSFVDRTHDELYFTNLIRWNTGAADMSTIRYPDDHYDRLWVPPPQDWASEWTAPFQRLTSSRRWSKTGPEINSVPSRVMEDAWWNDTRNYLMVDLPNTEAGSLVYSVFYFALLNESVGNHSISLGVQLDMSDESTFTVSHRPSQQSFFQILNADFTGFFIFNSSLLNALEFYEQKSFLTPTTTQSNVDFVNILKKGLNMTDWQGDPCTPVPYNWIECEGNLNQGKEWYVELLKLSHIQNSSRLYNLGVLQRNPLRYLSIRNSDINSDLFQYFLQNITLPDYLFRLDMSFNNISTFPNGQWWNQTAIDPSIYDVCDVDFSYNQLRQLPRFVEIPFSNTLESLNFSNNKISGEFPDITSFSNLKSLIDLNISYNNFYGKVPPSLSSHNLPNLTFLDISNNNFSGEFPSTLFFVNGHSTLEWLNADNNNFSGVLDLTTWFQSLKSACKVSQSQASSNSTNSTLRFNQFFSLLNNKISSIEPAIEEFQPMIEILINTANFNHSGILLGGNPYCDDASHFAQRYLCRSSTYDIIHQDAKTNVKEAIILSTVLGGGFILLFFIFFTVVIWRLTKKIQMFRMVEEELANRSVQPPFYAYNDLKLATQNFHESNRLGSGGYGEVYKGVLSDGTAIAVKKLFNTNSKEKQVLNEFLNEVVLITGIKHKNLIQLKGCCIQNGKRILVYGFAENGSVEDALWGKEDKPKLSWSDRFKICVGVANGLTYLHEELEPKIIHRDIKPANVLLDKNCNAKIADFGTAKGFAEEIHEHVTEAICGTRGYFAPEYLSEGRLTAKADVFSFGVVALEIVSGRKRYDLRLPQEEVQLTSWAEQLQRSGSTMKLLDPVVGADYSEAEVLKVINVALMCLRYDPEVRPTMSEVEMMLLEGQERKYEVLYTAALQNDDKSSFLSKLYHSNFWDVITTGTISEHGYQPAAASENLWETIRIDTTSEHESQPAGVQRVTV